MPVYTLNTTADAVDAKLSAEMNETVFKTYNEGQQIIADDYEKNDKYVIISGRYILPKNVVTDNTPLNKKSADGDETEEKTESQSILDRAGIKGATSESIKSMDQSSKAYKNGIVYGAAAGLLTGLILRKKLLWFILGGALVGGHISIEMSKAKKAKYEII